MTLPETTFSSNNVEITHNLGIDHYISIYGVCGVNGDSLKYAFPFYQHQWGGYCEAQSMNENYILVSSSWSNNKVKLTIQYTKAADTPGTGPTPGNLVYLPSLYSEEEREVGVWTDGKPLYQKTYKDIQLTNSADVTVDSNFGDKTIVNFQCLSTGIENGIRYITPVQSLNTYNNYVWPRQIAGNLKIIVNRDWSGYTCDLTVQYTKTTDQPGSGKYLPDGQYAHHYSTSEKVVGTDTDGSTLYERTFNNLGMLISANTWTNTSISMSNISSWNVTRYRNVGNGYDNQYPMFFRKYNNILQVFCNYEIALSEVTLQYTKLS